MRVFAPGKVVLSGAYAVLEGAPAIVFATTRGAIASARSPEDDSVVAPEVLSALPNERPPAVDPRALFDGDKKLGLGASAAILVASLGFALASAGRNIAATDVREDLLVRALAAHAAVQGGGSGVDVAAAVHGGALVFQRLNGRLPTTEAVGLPRGFVWQAFFSGTSARTSELRGLVDALKVSRRARYDAIMQPLGVAAHDASEAVRRGEATKLVGALREQARLLALLGSESGAPIVPPSFSALAAVAADSSAVFIGAGAGGGDIGLYAGSANPPASFLREAKRMGFFAIEDLGIDVGGVRVVHGTGEKTT